MFLVRNKILIPANGMGSELPQLTMPSFGDDNDVYALMNTFAMRVTRTKANNQNLGRKEDDFRKNLDEIDKEHIILKEEKAALETYVESREQQVRVMERKLSSSEQTVEMLRKHVDDYRRELNKMGLQFESKDMIISELEKKIDSVELKMQQNIASEKDRMKKERQLEARYVEVKRREGLVDQKFRHLREVYNTFNEEIENIFISSSDHTSASELSVPNAPRTKGKESGKTASGEGALDLPIAGSSSCYEEVQLSNTDSVNTSIIQDNQSSQSGFFECPNAKNVAVSNLGYRKSQSRPDVKWIEHKPVGYLELYTLLKPKFKKKKLVRKLSVKDVINNAASNYALLHQEQDCYGEIKTNLFKGDILPTACGGAQIVFNEVEKVKLYTVHPMCHTTCRRKRSRTCPPLR